MVAAAAAVPLLRSTPGITAEFTTRLNSVIGRRVPYAAARREAAEELGLTLQPGPLPAVDRVPPRPGRTEGLMLVVDGGFLTDAETAAIALPLDELHSWRFGDPDAAAQRFSPLLARRVAAALAARTSGQVAYLEAGYHTTDGPSA